jgi:hypothetical protein
MNYWRLHAVESKCLAFVGAALIVGLGLGFALGTIFSSQQPGSSQTQLAIGEIEWGLEGDMLTMLIPINNLGGFPATIQSISVRANTTDSTWYTDPNPASINNGGDTITGTSSDTFEWTPIRGSAPVDFLLPGNTYVIKITVHDGDFEKTVTAQLEWD